MPNNGLATTSKRQASYNELVAVFLVKIAEICQQEITENLTQIWIEQLRDIPVQVLERALDQTLKTWRSGFLPTPGNVRGLIENTNSAGLELEAQEGWRKLLAWIERWWHPDLGIIRGAPDLQPNVQHAVRAAGGVRHLAGCSQNELQWARKRFIEDFIQVRELNKSEYLLTDRKTKEIVAGLCRESKLSPDVILPKVSDKSSVEAIGSPEVDSLKRQFEQARRTIDAPLKPANLNEENYEGRKKEQVSRLTSYLKEHPELSGIEARVEKQPKLSAADGQFEDPKGE